MVGHTHKDIDALFGHVSMWLRKHDALTLSQVTWTLLKEGHGLLWFIIYHCQNNVLFSIDFLQGIKAAKADYVSTHIFTEMFDVKAWLSPHMESLHNHSHPHIFRFRKAVDGCCYMQYKHWRHSDWEPQSGHGIKILKV